MKRGTEVAVGAARHTPWQVVGTTFVPLDVFLLMGLLGYEPGVL